MLFPSLFRGPHVAKRKRFQKGNQQAKIKRKNLWKYSSWKMRENVAVIAKRSFIDQMPIQK
jgi:hypothetical protein